MIDKITDFYDCKNKDNSITVAHGELNLENVFCTLLGATTPTSFQSSMTTEAYGGGFMSRCMVVKEGTGYRRYNTPVMYPGVPDSEELSKRMAYIAEHAVGRFELDEGAYNLYAKWYDEFKDRLQQSDPEEILHQDNRREIHTLKLALILAAQRYDKSAKRRHIIEEDDIANAIKIIDYTIATAEEDITRASMLPENIADQKIIKIISAAGPEGITKSELLRRTQRVVPGSKELVERLQNLKEGLYIDAFASGNGRKKGVIEGHHEIYKIREI